MTVRELIEAIVPYGDDAPVRLMIAHPGNDVLYTEFTVESGATVGVVDFFAEADTGKESYDRRS